MAKYAPEFHSSSLTRDELFREVKLRLKSAFGERLEAVIVYGSEARGEAEPDSDIDLMLVLEGGEADDDGMLAVRALEPLQTAFADRVIHPYLVSADRFAAQDRFLFREAKRDGIYL